MAYPKRSIEQINMSECITIKEAAKLTGKSELSIRRLIRHLINQTTNQTDQVTGQTISQVIKREKTPQGFSYKVDKNFILNQLKSDALKATNRMSSQTINHDQPNDQVITQVKSENTNLLTIISLLKDQLNAKDTQLKAKDQQIEEQNKIIGQMVERDRETNILMKNLQDKLLLESPKEPLSEENHEATLSPELQQKKGFFARLLKRQAPARTT